MNRLSRVNTHATLDRTMSKGTKSMVRRARDLGLQTSGHSSSFAQGVMAQSPGTANATPRIAA
jgi:hypothetical protein